MRPPVDVPLPAIEVVQRRVTTYDFGLKDHYNPLADWITSHTPELIRSAVRRVVVAVLARLDPRLTVEVTTSGVGQDTEISLVGAHVHGFRSASATLLGVGPHLVVHPTVEPGDYREVETRDADGRVVRRVCREFSIFFDVELGFNPGISTRLVPVRLILPISAGEIAAVSRVQTPTARSVP